jgi:CheY-like chemotaxis protein
VDDNTLTWMVAHPARLRGVNYRDGEVALEMVLSGSCRRFAVIFWDNQMPVMSGLSLVKQFREAERNDFVVGMTGNALLSDQEEYIAAGVCRCPLYFFLRLVCEELDRGKI